MWLTRSKAMESLHIISASQAWLSQVMTHGTHCSGIQVLVQIFCILEVKACKLFHQFAFVRQVAP